MSQFLRFLLLATLFPVAIYAQKVPLEGYFDYKATQYMPDTNIVVNSWNVRIYTNDTVVRVETETQLGMQVYIRHMSLNKAYLLLDFEGQRYAIQTDLEKNMEKADTVASKLEIKKKRGKRTIAGVKCRRYHVIDKRIQREYDCYFAQKIDNKYLEVFKEVPGLAVDYYLASEDGLVHYELTGLTLTDVNRDLFGVPSDCKRITFDEFVNLFTKE